MPTLSAGWTDNPQDPGRIRADDPRVLALLARTAPDHSVTDLGGSFSLNLHLMPGNHVLRVHRPFVTRRRLMAEQTLRKRLTVAGITVPLPISVNDRTLLVIGKGHQRRLAELEPFIDTVTPESTVASYRWLFGQLGSIHRVLVTLPAAMPRSLAATWGTPESIRRWLTVTKPAVAADVAATALVGQAASLLPAIRRRWVAPRRLPQHQIHGDVRLGNIVRDRMTEGMVLFDTGFADVRPRVWDLAYALGFMELALNAAGGGGHHDALWPELLAIYEECRGESLTPEEHDVIPAMAAIALLHTLFHAGYMAEPATVVRNEEAFLHAAIHLLEA